mgnify:CR=1 FL=1
MQRIQAVETVLTSRINDQLELVAPGFDPAIISTMMELLMDLLSNCGNKTSEMKPEDAVERVKNMSGFEQAMLKSRLKKRARQDGVRDADSIAPKAVKAVKIVATTASPEEQLEFAASVLNVSSPEYEMI